MKINNYSVLMSVYNNEIADYLDESIQSMVNQTVPPSEFVLVCDGLLNNSLENVIEKYEKAVPFDFKVVRLPENVGLGFALNAGLSQCTNELIARMDSDDISFPDRCEKQLNIFNKNSEIAVCSGSVNEFVDLPRNTVSYRKLPENHNQIIQYSKHRNPFNHPCVMYKKSAVEAVGCYEDYRFLEDYQLWIKLFMNGYKGYNIQQPILNMRVGGYFYRRRGGINYASAQIKLFSFMLKSRYIALPQFVFSCTLRSIISIIPEKLRGLIYKYIIRTK